MSKFLKVVLVILGLLALTIPAAAVSASAEASSSVDEASSVDEGSSLDQTVLAERPSLKIKSPGAAGAGESVSFKVVSTPDGAPVGGAGIWAIDIDNITGPTVAASPTAETGVCLGFTDNTGVLTYAFAQTGRYLLAACCDGYNPGFGWIKIYPLIPMSLFGPASAYTGQTCEFNLFETNNEVPVSGAAVWAFPKENLSDDDLARLETADSLESTGILMGYTDNSGRLYYAFPKSGKYHLVALKTGYRPAHSAIKIIGLKELAVRNPSAVRVGAETPIRVLEKSVLTVEIPVAGADVWALSRNQAVTFNNVSDLLLLAKEKGLYLGATDESGYVIPRPRFKEAGRYWLIAVKEGSVPGISQIRVIDLSTATPSVKTTSLNNASTGSAR